MSLRNKTQAVVVKSSVEAEYKATAQGNVRANGLITISDCIMATKLLSLLLTIRPT